MTNPLADDCFSGFAASGLVSVDDALERLRASVHRVVEAEDCPLSALAGRILAVDVVSPISNPPQDNAAVDGYAFASESVQPLMRISGRSAAGQPFAGTVPPGYAIRVLTGAVIPNGCDTVAMQEHCVLEGDQVSLDRTVAPGANVRRSGEDLAAGDLVLPAGTRINSAAVALLASAGIDSAQVYRRLRVGVLSTGDELATPGYALAQGQLYDTNGPMLRALVQQWGYQFVDLGWVPDDAHAVQAAFDRATTQCDVILTSGGVSIGDEDHVSRYLSESGQLTSWRLALKPGKPLALAMVNSVPVVGLPGNPVAAWVGALRFAAPMMSVLAGCGWFSPAALNLPAGFSKTKKAGRTEYLRARIRDGRVEVFPSESSARVTGLAWSEGLVELGHDSQHIEPGDAVRYLPYASFGL